MHRRMLLTAGILTISGLTAATPAVAFAAPTAPESPDVVNVIVQLQEDSDVDAQLQQVVELGGRPTFTYRDAVRGFAVEIPRDALASIEELPQVTSVEVDAPTGLMQTPEPSTSQAAAPWGLDRVDQPALPLNGGYTFPESAGAGVTAYVIDTGILSTHTDFTGRVLPGFNVVRDSRGTADCQGHGTHVSGTVAGTTYGVAKLARVVPVRVADCNGAGTVSQIIAGVDWATTNHQAGPAVANMSLGVPPSNTLDAAVQALIDDGVTVVAAAGNSNNDACTGSPARLAPVITVGATTRTDARSSFSSFGRCLDLFAPGSEILSDSRTSNTATATLSGTSMASPHVAGAAALLLGENGTLSPAQVSAELVADSTPNVVTNPGAGSPNRMLRTEPAGTEPVGTEQPSTQP